MHKKAPKSIVEKYEFSVFYLSRRTVKIVAKCSLPLYAWDINFQSSAMEIGEKFQFYVPFFSLDAMN